MPTVVVQGTPEVRIPEWVVALESFRRWADTEEFPEEGRIDYLQGEVWIDMSWEQVFSHVLAKTEFTSVLAGVVKAGDLGLYRTDGLRLSNVGADLSAIPDGTFISNESMEEANIQLIEGKAGGYREIEGVPDMVLEIISDSSVTKDTKRLFKMYWEAGIKEYWLVDVRGERLSFEIYRHAAKGYVATRKKDGWLKSKVFGKSFRLTRAEDRFGNPRYGLEVQ
ncbi:MAG TPA: Uma2 family endonuclease [Gemmataceae bacterium]|nr:Uma2 family endonuclease [Gemmataceae bacterium]